MQKFFQVTENYKIYSFNTVFKACKNHTPNFKTKLWFKDNLSHTFKRDYTLGYW